MKPLPILPLALALASPLALYGESRVLDQAGPPPEAPDRGAAQHAASIAKAKSGGRVLDVRPLQNEASASYRVRLLIDPGRVRTVIVDADSGLVR